jgi:ferritin-like protein
MLNIFRTFISRLLLEAAISHEEKAFEFYQEALGLSVANDAFDLFQKLLGAELGQRLRLEEMQRRIGRRGDGRTAPDRSEEETGEVLGVAEAALPAGHALHPGKAWPVIDADDSILRVLRKALHGERCALRFYHDAAAGTTDGELYDLFRLLMHEELHHISWIEKELGKGNREITGTMF